MQQQRVSRRRFLRWSLLGAAATSMAACKPQVVEKEVVKEVTKEVEKMVTQVVEVTPVPTKVEQVTIDFWWGWTPEVHVNTLNGVCRRFEELNPDIKVQTAQHEWGPKLLTAIAAGTPPDLSEGGWPGELAARGALLELEPYIANSKTISKESYNQASWDVGTVNGKIYGIPALEQFVYEGQIGSVELYEKEGLKLPDDLPVTLGEAMAQIKTYTRRNDAGDITLLWGDIDRYSLYWYELVVGKHAYNAGAGAYDFSDPLWAEVLRWTGNLYQMLGPDKVDAFHSSFSQWTSVAANSFASGTQAWQSPSGYWEVGETAKTAPGKQFCWYWTPVWENRRGVKCVQTGGHTVFIPKAAKHPDQAWRLIEFLVSPEALKMIFNGSGFLTATRAFLDDPGQVVDFYKYPGLRFWVDSLLQADEVWSEAPGPIPGFAADKWGKAVDSVVLGQATPEQALAELQRLVDEEVANVTKQ